MASIVRAAIGPTTQQAATVLRSSIRHESSQATRRVTILVNGVTGEIGREVAKQAMERDHKVIGFSRDPSAPSRLSSKGLTVVHTPEEATKTPEFWHKTFEKYATGDCMFVQTAGAQIASTLDALKAANVAPVAASAEAFKAREGHMEGGGRYVQLSTLSTQIVPDLPYGSTKEEANEALIKQRIGNALILDIGYALPPVEEKGHYSTINSNRVYFPTQFSALPALIRVHPVIGSGTQLFQPVYEEDVAKAILNFEKGQLRLAAVGRQVISQENFMRFFAELAGHSFHPMHIPVEVVQCLAKHFPQGYFNHENAHALELLEKETRLFDPEPFEKLLQARAKTLNEMYPSTGKSIICIRPPIMKHIRQIATTLATSSEARTDTYEVLKKHGSTLIKNFLTC